MELTPAWFERSRAARRVVFFAKEAQQLGSDFLCVRPGDAVRAGFRISDSQEAGVDLFQRAE